MTNNLSAIVLAGGMSSRMGQDKALIPIQGVPLLQLICQIAESCADTIYVVTPWQERYQHLVTPKIQFIREISLNKSLPHGPLVGFAQGLAQVQTDWVLLLACDLPKLQVEVLQEWVAELKYVDEDAIAALCYTKSWEPLCGFYRRRSLPSLVKYIDEGGRSFQGWLKQNHVFALSLPNSEMLFNCNTPQDLSLT
ncbi:molybdenum cofactor guanylyltransferase [Scytonema sp. NUACC26]|uniref:molybdenum cofactor guanylyltransferase n=1 Tax=Scytonema sp. NUACC26 TaxID=3140176 RepID=UPI0034DC1690